MATTIGKWSTQATLDAQGFTSGITAMTRGANQAKAQMDSAFGGMQARASSFFTSFGSSAIGFATSLPEALGLTSISGILSNLNQTFEEEMDLSFTADSLGASIEFLSTLRTVASESSVSATQLTGAVEFLNQTLGNAIQGGTEAQEAFERLGLSWRQLQGQSFDATFMQVAHALEAIEDRAVRARTARELFGRGGAAGILRVVDNIDAQMADVQARGGFTTPEDVERFQQMDNAIDRMTTAWRNTWRDWLSTVAPVLTDILNALGGAGDRMEANAQQGEVQSRERMSMAMLFRAVRDFDATGDQTLIDPLRLGDQGAILNEAFVNWEDLGNGQFRMRLNLEAIRAQMESLAAFAEMDANPTGEATTDFAEDMGDRVADIFARHARVAEQNAREAERLIEQQRTPFEQFEQAAQRIAELLAATNLSPVQAARANALAFEQLAGTIPERTLPRFFEQGSADALSLVNRQAIQPTNEMQRVRQIMEAAQARDEERNRHLQEVAAILTEMRDAEDEVADDI